MNLKSPQYLSIWPNCVSTRSGLFILKIATQILLKLTSTVSPGPQTPPLVTLWLEQLPNSLDGLSSMTTSGMKQWADWAGQPAGGRWKRWKDSPAKNHGIPWNYLHLVQWFSHMCLYIHIYIERERESDRCPFIGVLPGQQCLWLPDSTPRTYSHPVLILV